MNLGQLLILKVNELRWNSSLERFLRRLQPGGVVIDAPLTGGAGAGREFLTKVACAVPTAPFLALREEGGVMDPLGAFLPALPSPHAVAGKGLAAVRRLGELVGAAFEFLGFNTDLAPLLDLAPPDAGKSTCEPVESPSPTLRRVPTVEAAATRAFSPDPQQMANCGAAFLVGLERHEVRACGKHFPGLAGAQSSTVNGPPLVSKSMAQLWREDLVPYRALLPRLPFVLVSTASYKAYDFDFLQCAGLSPKVVEGLLRTKLSYDGIAIACGLETKAVRGTLTLEEAAVQALGAGCDMLLLEETAAAERVPAALRTARESGKLPNPRFEQALGRIQLAKQGLRPPREPLPNRSLDRIAKEFIDFSSDFTGSG
ncbi:MAG TPA: glycoside hydrolase family 3 N-terminal domain-containing protein [Terriglobia bacterium]|nr:glycoside hydrolase family 3 N-terminal domain-containing protein [Terriglobia bacterium]